MPSDSMNTAFMTPFTLASGCDLGASYKLAILSEFAFGMTLAPDEIAKSGLRSIQKTDVEIAQPMNSQQVFVSRDDVFTCFYRLSNVGLSRTKMSEEGWTYDESLAKAQELGYAESDPTNDVAKIPESTSLISPVNFKT